MKATARGSLTGVAVLVIVFTAVRAELSQRAWEEMLVVGSEVRLALAEADQTRPVLYGTPLEGLAFEDYRRAIVMLESLTQEQLSACDSADSDRALRDSLLGRSEQALRALDRGARRRDARYPVAWEDNAGFPQARLGEYLSLIRINTLAAERHAEQEEFALAVDVLLRGMQMGRDLALCGYLVNERVGAEVLASATEEAVLKNSLLERLPTVELLRLAAGMRELDSALNRPTRAWDGEIASFTHAVSHNFPPGVGARFSAESLLGSLPFRSSTREMLAEYAMRTIRDRDRMASVSTSTWTGRRQVLADIASATNPHYARFARLWLPAEAHRLQALARLRLTRVVVEYRATGSVSRFADPFGGELRVTEFKDRLRFASRGCTELTDSDQLFVEIARRDG